MSVSGALKLFRRRLRSAYAPSVPIKNTIVGAASDIDQLLEIINKSTASASEKITAAGIVRSLIETRTLSSIQEVWQSTRILLDLDNPADVRQAGWRLTTSCIEHDDINVGAFNAYYYTIIDFSNIEDFHLVLKALDVLTDHGRRITSGQVTVYRLPTVIISWIQLLALRSQELRSNSQAKDVAEPWGTTTAENFHHLLGLATNTLKFNMSVYEEEDIDRLLRVAVAVVRNTSSTEDIRLSCGLIDTIMAFGIIPIGVLQPILQVLSGITLISDDLADIAWNTIEKFARSHLGNSTLRGLCLVLEPKENAEITTGMRAAAVQIIAKLVIYLVQQHWRSSQENIKRPTAAAKPGQPRLDDLDDFDVAIPMDEIMTAYANVLGFPSLTIAIEVCKAVQSLLANPLTYRLFDYDIWQSASASPLNLVCIISELLTPSMTGKLNRAGLRPTAATAILPVAVKSHGDNGAEPKPVSKPSADSSEESTLSAAASLARDLSRLLSFIVTAALGKESFVPLEETIHVAVELSLFLEESAALSIVDAFAKLHYCSPYMPGWTDKFDLLLSSLYVHESCSAAVRVAILTQAREIYLLVIGTDEVLHLMPITRKLYSILDNADGATTDALLDMYQFISASGSWELFEAVTDMLVSSFPDQSLRRVLSSDQSARQARVAERLTSLFLETFLTTPKRARYLYYAVIQVAKASVYDEGPFRNLFALLCRLRVNEDLFLSVAEPSLEPDYGQVVQLQAELPGGSEYFNRSSLTLKRLVSLYETEENTGMTPLDESQYTVDPAATLSLVINIIQNGAPVDVFALVLINLPTQLSNVQFYNGCEGELVTLRNLLYSQIGSGKLPQALKIDGTLKQELLCVEVHALTILLAFDRIFQKPDHDKLVQTLVLSMNQWDKTANWALHCLIVCCYECPSSVQRFMPQILSKLQTKISSNESATHILEFVLTICLVESLTDNFNMQEFKRVFGICFSYIQHAHGILAKSKSKAETDVNNSILSQYLLKLAFSSINFLFLAMDVNNRPEIVPYLIRSLILADGDKTQMSSMSTTAFDFICRYAYANQPLSLSSKAVELSRSNQGSGNMRSGRWVVGSSVFEVSSNELTGEGTIIYRRPTGTLVCFFNPALLGKTDRNRKALSMGETLLNFTPESWLLQMHGLQNERLNVIPIPYDSQSNRAVATLDRAPVVDFHKVGIIYIGPGQSDEIEILSNDTGSQPYRKFLNRIGKLVRLKDNREIYAGGLDTEMDSDGKFTYGWRGKISQIIYHVTTMMPKQDDDRELASKKRHIGNNFVNIYFDQSDREFEFNTVKSQFNFINIVISPTGASGKYRVRAYRKPGLDNVLAAYERKVISEEQLPLFCRHLALKASQYASVYNQQGEYTDNWLYRLDMIEKLKERLLQQRNQLAAETVTDAGEQVDMELLANLDFTSVLGLPVDQNIVSSS